MFIFNKVLQTLLSYLLIEKIKMILVKDAVVDHCKGTDIITYKSKLPFLTLIRSQPYILEINLKTSIRENKGHSKFFMSTKNFSV